MQGGETGNENGEEKTGREIQTGGMSRETDTKRVREEGNMRYNRDKREGFRKTQEEKEEKEVKKSNQKRKIDKKEN